MDKIDPSPKKQKKQKKQPLMRDVIDKNGNTVHIVDSKVFKMGVFMKVPQVLYKNNIFLPVFKNKRTITDKDKRTIDIYNLGKIDIFFPVLNQVHINIIDAILYNALKYKILEDNSVSVVFIAGDVCKTLGIGENYLWLYDKIKEIQMAVFRTYNTTDEYKGMPADQMPLINNLIQVDDLVQNRYIGVSDRYAPYRVIIFSPLFGYLMQNSYVVSYPRSLLLKILDLKYAVNQAIVRYCIASGNVNESLEKLLVKLGVAKGETDNSDEMNKSFKERYIAQVRQEQEKLAYFNIQIGELKNKKIGIFRKAEDTIRIFNAKKYTKKPTIKKDTKKE